MSRLQMGFSLGVILLLCVLVAEIHAGTTGKITGQVTDTEGNVLPGASVVIEGTLRGTMTDREGVYFLISVEPGKHPLVTSMIGYESQRKEDVLVTSDFTTNESFVLKEVAIPIDEMVVEAQHGTDSWGMFTLTADAPAVEPDKTASRYVVRSEDIEALPIVRDLEGFIGLQAGVVVDAEGDEITIRAGDPREVAYYFDGVPIPSTDHVGTRVYRNFNRLAIQEMTIVTGGVDAEYGNAQGGVVSVVIREGGKAYHGLMDYQFAPPGKKHWGRNVYDSPIHQGNARWDDPAWLAETATLPDGREVPAHQRADYTGVSGHLLEGNLSGPLMKNAVFFLSSRWQREASVFPGPYAHTPFNLNTLAKITVTPSENIKLRFGGLYDWRKGANVGPDIGGVRDLQNDGTNLFLVDPRPAGEFVDADWLVYAGITHLLSDRTFYEVQISRSVSRRDTTGVHLGEGVTHLSEAVTGLPVMDRAGRYAVYREVVDLERFDRKRWILKADFSSQVNRRHYVKTGLELIRFNNWSQLYKSDNVNRRFAGWYGKTYEDTDLFPGQSNRGVTPLQLGAYVQDKIELDGMIVNAGLRYDVLFQKTWVTDHFLVMAPMWRSMTLSRNAPVVKGPRIQAWSPRLGISHPVTEASVLRFYYGRSVQFPSFLDLFWNSWLSSTAGDRDLNENGAIEPAERWNTFGSVDWAQSEGYSSRSLQSVLLHNPYIRNEETQSLEVGFDWNFASDYVLGLTTYYKRTNDHFQFSGHRFISPHTNVDNPANHFFTTGIFRDTGTGSVI